jgi:hypothetical protein
MKVPKRHNSRRHLIKEGYLYASCNDNAKISKGCPQLSLGRDTKRGLSSPPMETLDVSALDTGLDGHSYYGDNSTVISDMFYLVHDGKRAGERFGMKEVSCPAGMYWQFVPRR